MRLLQTGNERLEQKYGGNIADDIGEHRSDTAKDCHVVEVLSAQGSNDIRRQHCLFDPAYNDKQADEHNEQRPIDLDINFFRLYPPREQQECTADDCHLGDRLSDKKQHHHGRHDKHGLEQQRAMEAHLQLDLFHPLAGEELASIGKGDRALPQ